MKSKLLLATLALAACTEPRNGSLSYKLHEGCTDMRGSVFDLYLDGQVVAQHRLQPGEKFRYAPVAPGQHRAGATASSGKTIYLWPETSVEVWAGYGQTITLDCGT